MKLKDGIITDRFAENQYVAVATGEAGKVFNGMIRSNKTADFIVRELMTDKTEDELVSAVTARYDVDPQRARQDIKKIIQVLKDTGLLDD